MQRNQEKSRDKKRNPEKKKMEKMEVIEMELEKNHEMQEKKGSWTKWEESKIHHREGRKKKTVAVGGVGRKQRRARRIKRNKTKRKRRVVGARVKERKSYHRERSKRKEKVGKGDGGEESRDEEE